MSEPKQHVDEELILGSLYGTSLPGLREMLKKRNNGSIKHLIVRAIELKESQTNEGKAAGSGRTKRRLPKAG